MKILACGDTHGDFDAVRPALENAHTVASWLVQVGDFGYWEHTRSGNEFLTECSRTAAFFGVPILFLDGNHENHPLLWEKYADSPKTPEGFWQIRDHLYYAPRGLTWNWGAKKCLALGGAVSIDRCARTPGYSWWATEEISQEEEDKSKAVGKVDILFAHDCPISVDPFQNRKVKIYPETEANRRRLERVVEATHPDLLIHGHYHIRYTSTFEHRDGTLTTVDGLAADGEPGTTLLIDLGETK